MKKGLLIVESPAKTRTLKRYLGKDFDVRASVGHIKDLPRRHLGVDIEHDFAPEYEVIRGKGKIIKELKSAASKVQDIYLATDPDREGEAIAWHIAGELQGNGRGKGKDRHFYRVLFNELTEKAIKEAIKAPGTLDKNRFESQQARRILDRLVGYEISPLLWDKVKRGLSAGRVQSVAVRIICDREREIQAFEPEEYWTVTAKLEGPEPPPFEARVVGAGGKKISIPDGQTAGDIVKGLESQEFVVKKVETKARKKNPPPPFITSTLQQDAARKLRFQAKKTMMIAQKLYEGVGIGAEGPVGLITYMRTDSTRISSEAAKEARGFIRKEFGPDYVPKSIPRYKKGKMAQDAHEAIRPTSVARTPKAMSPYLDKDALALYGLIWRRFVASQMSPAIMDQTRVDIEAGTYALRANGTVLRFKGYLAVYSEVTDDAGKDVSLVEKEKDALPRLASGQRLDLLKLLPKQHFTQPPPRYTEASLIKTLEEKGIGRPSTYATILSTIRNKDYVRMEQRRFIPTELGLLVTDLLVTHFPEILDTSFTADMEKKLDEVEEGSVLWTEVLRRFYDAFRRALDKAKKEMRSVKQAGIATQIVCDKCGAPMVIKYGRTGEFLSCSAYPKCKNIKDFVRDEKGNIRIEEKKVQEMGKCDRCGRPMVVKRGRYGKFLACSGYPECRNTKPLSTGVKCPVDNCGGELVEKRSRSGKTFYSCSRYPECKYATWDEPVAETCPRCGFKILVIKNDKKDGKVLKCPQKGCGYKRSMKEN